jgi:hypothetical protein
LSLMVVQASSAAAREVPAAMVIATGKPAAMRAGFSKAAPESPAARGRAATAIIWPRREKALLTADAIPECREPTLASTTAVIGVISAASPVPNTTSEGSTPVRYRSPTWIRAMSSSPAPVRTAPIASGIRGPMRCAIAPDGRDRISISAVIGSVAAPA